MSDTIHVMIDFETLDTEVTSAVTAVGVVGWREGTPLDTRVYFTQSISLDDCIKKQRTLSADTIIWWMQQSDEARASWIRNQSACATLDGFLLSMEAFFPPEDSMLLYGNGADFDLGILKSLYKTVGREYPYNFRNHRCFRTLKAEHTDIPYVKPTVSHDPFYDAKAQLVHLQKILGFKNG